MADMMKNCMLALIMSAPLSVLAAEPATAPAQAGPRQQSSAQTEGPAVDTSDATKSPAAAPAPRRAGNDRLDLDTTVVTGNRELPKVLYIVPWKKADLGDLPGQPFNTLLDEVLTPVDRDVFRREVTYYGAVSSGGNSAGDAAAAPAALPGGTEK
jgi:hypothetical protein